MSARRTKLKRRTSFILLAAFLILALGARAPREASADPYVALGDSIGAGWNASGHSWFANPDDRGFVNLFYADLQTELGADQLFNYSEPGATAASILTDNNYLQPISQITRALAQINDDASDTKAVTVEVGANEYFAARGGVAYTGCFGAWDSPECPYRQNLESILTQLKSALATDPGDELFEVMGYFNPGVGTAGEGAYDLGLLGANQAIGCEDSGGDVGLNDVVYQEAGALGVAVADPYPAFKAGGPGFMSDGAHPNDAGHDAIRQSFLNASTPCPGPGLIDRFAPDTAILSAPSVTSNVNDPSFSFASSEANSNFDCTLDGGAWSPCTSPKSYAGLTDGHHTFQVRAVDANGNTDAFPAAWNFAVDTSPPDTAIDVGPIGTIATGEASFTFAGNPVEDTVVIQCQIDTGPFTTCVSPMNLSGLTDGPHTVTFRAEDAVGNQDQTPATRDFAVDTSPPDTAIASGPAGTVATGQPTFVFTGVPTTDTAEIQCQIDAGAFAECASPMISPVLADGPHTVTFRAQDAVGNQDQTPVTRDFTVDTTPPDTFIDSGPTGTITTDRATFTFAGTPTEDTARIRCRVDSGASEECASPMTTPSLADGPHTVTVTAEDAAGNQDQTPPTWDFTVDTTVYRASIGKVTVRGPGTVEKRRKITYRVRISNYGNLEARGLKLRVGRRGVGFHAPVESIAAARSRIVEVTLKLKRPGKTEVSFAVTSRNAGEMTARKMIDVNR